MKYYIKTFGCQMNVNDSEKMHQILTNKGLKTVSNEEEADIIILNSCAVREKAQEKIFSFVGRIPANKKIIIAGCVAQSEGTNMIKRSPRIDYVIGTHQYFSIDNIVDEIMSIENFRKEIPRQKRVKKSFSKDWTEIIPDKTLRESPFSGFVSIMEGCNNFCSYCIVPFTRGREKHRPFKQILDEAIYLTGAGYKEIVLLGQNVNSWEDKKNNMKFHDLLALLARKLPVKWIRFITSYPGYYENELIDVMEKYPNIARHIHFPVQSGSTRILKKMNRTYTRTQYLKIINDFKKRIPEITFSSDFIIGFPQETERDFELTMSLLKKVEYDSMFSFIYSKREHTKAKEFKDNLTKEINKERLYKLQNLQKEIQLKHNKALIGKAIEVLVTGINKKNPEEFVGRTESYKTVNFKSEKKSIIGNFVNVKIERVGPYSLRGISVP